MKKIFYSVLMALVILSATAISTLNVYSNPPEPKCVCAECGRPCGSGHASNCSSK